ncbi:MAG: Holliday junction branch migration protein RuvA [Deltaproteobacteria bacterium]|nr:Holliday junction branch migration protein RuvA [Deltaproteobacteria bacterium]
MIASLQGRILAKQTSGAIIECGGVGYGVSMSLASLSKLGSEGSDARLYVHTHVAQDVLRLYGFVDPAEKETFEVLIATTGVGPKLALAILSAVSPEDLAAAVATGDKAALTRIPGIGNKTAERLLVELKHRLPERPVTTVRAASPRPNMGDLVSALVNLGFKLAVAEAVARETIELHPDDNDVAVLVRHALRASTR